MAICPNCGSWVDEGDICRNCGGKSSSGFYDSKNFESPAIAKADMLGKEAWKLYEDYRDEEALMCIDLALSYNPRHSNNWNRKAIILEGLGRFEQSKECYDKSLSLRRSNVVIDNKARMIKDWVRGLYEVGIDLKMAVNLLNEAIDERSSIQTEENVDEYRDLARRIQNAIDYKR